MAAQNNKGNGIANTPVIANAVKQSHDANNNNKQIAFTSFLATGSSLAMTHARVPKLRFKEFEGEWEQKKLETLVNSISSGKIKPNNEGEYLVYGSTGVIGRSNKFTHEGEYILIARVGANAGRINRVSGKYAVTDNTLIIDSKNDVLDNCFTEGFLEKFNLNRLIFGSGQPLITGGLLKGIKINLPNLPEQQKIANFLTAVDTKLQQLSTKKETLAQYKKGVMQQLFSQQLRFKPDVIANAVKQSHEAISPNETQFPDWEEKRLGEVAYITTGSSNRVDSSLDGEYTFFDRSEDIRTSSIFLFDAEAIIVPGEGQKFTPKYFIGKFDLHQRSYAIMNFNECDGKFIFYHIGFHTNYLLSQAVGSTVKSLRLPMFKKMKINFPSLKEQQKIATYLSAIDKKIEAVQTQIAKTQEFKKGLLQQMFV